MSDTADVNAVAFAMIRRIADALTIDVDPAEGDLLRSFSSPEGFSIGHYVFDSLDVVNSLLEIEEDLGVDLLEPVQAGDVDSFEMLARVAMRAADSRRLSDFVTRWS